jgi:uncharacterized protein involved in exopolysaccharide biosynthesis
VNVSLQDTLSTSAPYVVSRAEATAPRPPADDREPTPPALADVILARRWVILAVAMVSAVVVGVTVLLTTRTYTSSTSFILQGNKAGSAGVAGVAAQLGLAGPVGESWHQPAFYADLLRTREILEPVAAASYCSPCAPRRVELPLARILEIDAPDAPRRQEKVVNFLKRAVTPAIAPRTGMLTLKVETSSPWLSQQLAQRLLDGVISFNMGMRQSQASAERQFTERRLQEVAAQLRAAELELQDFLRTNRSYQGSPELRFRENRLAREVQFRQELYIALARAYEQARIDEVRDTPVLAVVERPNLPLRPDPRGTLLKAMFGAVLGAVVGTLFFFARSLYRTRRQRPARSVRV